MDGTLTEALAEVERKGRALKSSLQIPPGARTPLSQGPGSRVPGPSYDSDAAEGYRMRFSYGGQMWEVDLAEVIAMFTVGKVTMTQVFDPTTNPNVEVYNLPENIRAWYLSRKALRPGRYEYMLTLDADSTVLSSFLFDSLAPMPLGLGGLSPPRAFQAGDTGTVFRTKVFPSLPYQNVTVHFLNGTDQDGTALLYGSYHEHGDVTSGDFGQLSTNAVAHGTLLPVGQDLRATLVPYMYAELKFATAPASGSLKIVPVARR